MSKGIALVRIAVERDHFDKLNLLILHLVENDTTHVSQARHKFGQIKWTSGKSLINDCWIVVYIERYEFTLLYEYGAYMDDIWDDIERNQSTNE